MIVGIDVGSEKHDARAFTYRGIEISDGPLEFRNGEEDFETLRTWMEDLRSKNGLDAVMPGMEPVLVNPYHVKQSKEPDDNTVWQENMRSFVVAVIFAIVHG